MSNISNYSHINKEKGSLIVGEAPRRHVAFRGPAWLTLVKGGLLSPHHLSLIDSRERFFLPIRALKEIKMKIISLFDYTVLRHED